MSAQRPLGFLEDKLDPIAVVGERNAFVLSLIPYEETTTYIKGTARAPEAIVDASAHMEVFDETLHIDASRHGILTERPPITDLASVTAAARAVRELHPDALLGFVGGEHSMTPALIAGVARDNMGIVWLDAHADLRPEFYGRPDNHACAGFNSLPFGPIVQIGVRTLAEEEFTLIEGNDAISTHIRWDAAALAAIAQLPDDIYLSVDADGFSPELIRAVGTPEPGGLHWDDFIDIIDVVFSSKRVFAFDMVELCPQPGDVASTFTAAKAIYKIMTYHAHHRLESR